MQDIIPPQKKPKKSLKIIFIILAVIFLILVAVAFTYFLAKGKFQSSSNEKPKTEEGSKKEEGKEGEFVYVTSKAGLNLRSDATTSSPIIYTMPYRAKIKLEKKSRDDKWYKGTYDGTYEDVSGWFSSEFVQKEEPPDLTADWQDAEVNVSLNYTLKFPQDWRKKNVANSFYDIVLVPQAGGLSEISVQVKDGTIDQEKATLTDVEHNTVGDNPMVVDGLKGRKITRQKIKNSKIILATEVILLEKDGKLIRIEGPADNEQDADIYNLFVWTLKFKNKEQNKETDQEQNPA